jgi:hypothetical protein
MLSAVMQLLQNILKEATHERKQAIIDLCVAAYPDIRPWQVENACNGGLDDGDNSLYYTYLSQLLHPLDGHESARLNSFLVKVICSVFENCFA